MLDLPHIQEDQVQHLCGGIGMSKSIYDALSAKGSFTTRCVFQDYLKNTGLLTITNIEYNVYKWHRRQRGEASNYGWCRNMSFSISQQLTRQDLGYYLTQVILRPDHHTFLVTSPYYTKYAEPGDNTFFSHVDFNLANRIRRGQVHPTPRKRNGERRARENPPNFCIHSNRLAFIIWVLSHVTK
ncbi:hypothetical protein Q7P37_000269 [Cladosporium fusiforme]